MLQQQAVATQPGQHVASASPAMQRMQRAEQLVKQGVLTDAEVAVHKVGWRPPAPWLIRSLPEMGRQHLSGGVASSPQVPHNAC